MLICFINDNNNNDNNICTFDVLTSFITSFKGSLSFKNLYKSCMIFKMKVKGKKRLLSAKTILSLAKLIKKLFTK